MLTFNLFHQVYVEHIQLAFAFIYVSLKQGTAVIECSQLLAFALIMLTFSRMT